LANLEEQTIWLNPLNCQTRSKLLQIMPAF